MAKMKKSAPKRKMTERDILIEQCLMDAYCERTGEQLDEGWWDNMKAKGAGWVSGAKQGLKNFGDKASNAAKMTGNWFGRKADQASNIAKNLGAAANNQDMKKGVDPRSITQGISDPSKRIPAAFAKNYGKVQSYAKSLVDTLGAFGQSLEAAGMMNDKVKPMMDGIGEYLGQIVANKMETAYKLFGGQTNQAPAQPQGIDNAANMDSGDAPSEFGDEATEVENEEQINSSYDPRLNSRGQRAMLDMLK